MTAMAMAHTVNFSKHTQDSVCSISTSISAISATFCVCRQHMTLTTVSYLPLSLCVCVCRLQKRAPLAKLAFKIELNIKCVWASSPLRYFHAVLKNLDMVFSLPLYLFSARLHLFLVPIFVPEHLEINSNNKDKHALTHSHTKNHTHEPRTQSTFYQQTMLMCSSIYLFFLNFFCSEIEFDGVSIHATVFMYIYCLPAQISKCFGCALVQNRKFPHCHPTSISPHHHHHRRYHHHSHPSPTSARTSSLINFVVSLLIYSIWESKGGG